MPGIMWEMMPSPDISVYFYSSKWSFTGNHWLLVNPVMLVL